MAAHGSGDGHLTPNFKRADEISLEELSLSEGRNGFHRMRTIGPAARTGKPRSAEDYFAGPRDSTHHSKWPYFFRVHGSILPGMILPMVMVTTWSTVVTFACKYGFPNHQFDPILLTVTGFLVGLALSFRQSTAYERYMEGRRYWSGLTSTAENLARVIWIHVREREGEQGKKDLLEKAAALNLIVAFAHALKHKLKLKPYVDYPDIRGYVGYLDTYAKKATALVDTTEKPLSKWKQVGQFLNFSFAFDNPRAEIKQSPRPLGNLPLEILCYLQGYLDSAIDNKMLPVPIYQVQSISALQQMNDTLNGCERILNTPLPVAYSIAIAHITWLYILILPFQLYNRLKLNTIPATLMAAYIILGLALISTQIENPFGDDVNDLPLDSFCEQIAHDLDVISSKPKQLPENFMHEAENLPLYPLSTSGFASWAARSEEEIREALGIKVIARFQAQQEANPPKKGVKKPKVGDV